MKQIPFAELKEKSKIVRANEIQVDLPFAPIQYYRHGWQSWSLAAWTDLAPLPVQKPAIFHPLQINAEHAHKSHPNGSWVGAVQFADGNILLLGALTVDTHVSLLENQLQGQSDADNGEWFISYGEENIVFKEYTDALKIRFQNIKKNGAPRVWCSWYSLYTMIDEEILRETFDALGDLPFDVLQVDDGWQKNIGDWEANEKFSAGMAALAEKIKSTGRSAGLWLAPLIATKSSRLFREHAEWFLRDEKGLVSAGFNWGEHLFALDATRPEVTAWLAALMKQVRAWGFDYLKLDFLYAGALQGKRYKDMPRETAYRESLRVMREAMGLDAFFLTCGSPILPALGLCDAIRIGPDVSHKWEKHRDAVLFYNPTIPATRNAIRTSLNRLWLSPLLHIDPDVVYFESKKNSLAPEQKRLLQDLALICNFKATSDLPQWMTAEEREEARAFLNLTPQVERTGRYTFKIDDRVADFTSAIALPTPPQGLLALWAEILSWLGNQPLVLKIFKRMDDAALTKRRDHMND
ncbi:MAG: alpha-galactosidase [Anaerolineales bacterium]|nr:alpha-galactosidase [Anaerolineales bacterium]